MAAILDHYFHSTRHKNWVVAPEQNLGENHHPDYTIFEITFNPFKLNLMRCFELKSRTGNSWHALLKQLSLALESNNVGRVWLVGVKGLEICFYEFDTSTFNNQTPDCFDFIKPISLNLSEVQLVKLGLK